MTVRLTDLKQNLCNDSVLNSTYFRQPFIVQLHVSEICLRTVVNLDGRREKRPNTWSFTI